jgi:hypothetical protein
MNEAQDANDRFNRLWDEIGAKRIVIGDEDKGVEIVVDADLSIFSLIEKMKAAAREDQLKGELNEQDRKSVTEAIEGAKQLLEDKIDKPLRSRIDALFGDAWKLRHRRRDD